MKKRTLSNQNQAIIFKKEYLMKRYGFIYMFTILLLSSLHGEALQPSVQSLIQQIKSSKVENRRLLMNQLKIELRKMNKESRHNAMMELKKSFSKEHHVEKRNREQGKYKNTHQQQCTHQPKYRHLNRQGVGQGEGAGNGNRHK
jgi:alpha-galactosidase